MRKYDWLIIEYNREYVIPWQSMGKKYRRYARRTLRQLRKHCSSKSQYVLVKLNKILEE